MSGPRARRRGSLLFICRRTEGRALRMGRPEVMAAFAVLLADAARRAGVRLVAVAVLSDHYHAVVWDVEGRLAEFLRDLHAQVARFVNALDEVQARVWDGQQTDVRELVDADAVIEKVAYVLANPVKHRLVEGAAEWAGVLTRVEDLGGRGPRFERPAAFFAASGPVSTEVELAWVAPPMCVDAYGLEGFRARVRRAVDANVAAAHAAAAADGQGFVGMAAVAAQSPFARPRTPSGRSAGKKAKRRQRVAGSEDAAIAAAVERERVFAAEYRAARARWVAGERDVVFPEGTWQAWRYWGATRFGPDGTLEAPAAQGRT